jgi:hypothetical protein
MGENLEGTGCGFTDVPFQPLPGGAELNQKNVSQGSLCPRWDLNQPPLDYESRVLLVHQPARYKYMYLICTCSCDKELGCKNVESFLVHSQ